MPDTAKVLILTPMKSAARHLARYFAGLERLRYPAACLSLGILEGDSEDDTYAQVEHRLTDACRGFARKGLYRKDFGLRMPPGVPRYSAVYQIARRTVLARARNHLLFRAMQDEDWVLWLDVDVIEYPDDILQTLIGLDRDIVQPHCVIEHGGKTFDRNAWCDGGRKHMDDLRGQHLVRLESVGGTMLLVRRTGIATAWCSRRSSTAPAADGSAIRIRCAASPPARSRPRDWASWPRTWESNAGGCRTWRSCTPRTRARTDQRAELRL